MILLPHSVAMGFSVGHALNDPKAALPTSRPAPYAADGGGGGQAGLR